MIRQLFTAVFVISAFFAAANTLVAESTIAWDGFESGTGGAGWSGTVTPAKSGYTFDPNSIIYTSVTSELTAEDYNALPADDFNDNRRSSMWRRSR
ncbi:MAG: hypothetical protein ABII09_06425 [Planctomycetota bacterium]